MQGRWRMSESIYKHGDKLLVRQVVLSTLRYTNVSRDLTTKSSLKFRQLCALLIQFPQAIQIQITQKQMLSQSALWSLWTDNRIKSKKL
jgi:hypothetical protein